MVAVVVATIASPAPSPSSLLKTAAVLNVPSALKSKKKRRRWAVAAVLLVAIGSGLVGLRQVKTAQRNLTPYVPEGRLGRLAGVTHATC